MASATQDWRQLCRDAAAARAKVVSSLTKLIVLAEQAGVDAISAGTALRAEVAKWRTALEGASQTAETALEALDRRADAQLESLTSRVRAELSRRGCTMHGEGDTIIVDGIVHFVLNTRGRTATVNDVHVEDLTPERVAESACAQVDQLRKGMTKPPAMLSALREVYDLELRDTGKAQGAQVETESLMLRMAALRQTRAFKADPVRERFTSYARTQFRADLFWLLESRELDAAGRRFRHAAGSNTNGALFMLVPDLGHPAYVGRIWFDEAGASR
jgi:hypothetical protein